MKVEKIYLVEEIKTQNPEILEQVETLFADQNVEYISHSELKKKTKSCKAVVGTDEITPYANIILQKDERYMQPIFKVKAVDTTAAGDTFTGYFLAGLIAGMEIPDILQMSAKASSIAVTRPGAVQSIPYRKEAKRL